jgi:uncharacterized protein (TIGR03437 family)
MRFLWPFVAIAVSLCTAAAQDLPQSVDLIQRIDTLYPWLPGGSLAIDAQGNIYVSTSIQSSLPDSITNRIGPLTPANNANRYNIVIVKLDPTGQHILYGTAIGGSNGNDASGIQVDAAGNAYVSGSTISDDFPASSFLGGSHRGSVFFKLDPNGKLVFSTVLAWADLHIGGTQIGPTGAIYISGGIKPGELSPSPSAFDPTPLDFGALGTGFIAKLDPAGTRVEAATYVPASAAFNLKLRRNGDVLFSAGGMFGALDASLSTLVFSTPTNNFPTIQLDDAGNIYVGEQFAVKKYAPDGTHLLFTFDIASPGSFDGFTVTHSGMMFLFLSDVPPNFPTYNGTQPCQANLATPASPVIPGSRVLLVIGPQGDVRYATYMSEATTMAVSSANDHPYGFAYAPVNLTTPGWIGLVHFNPDELPSPHAFAGCLVHSGTLNLSSAAPGTIMTIFGEELGPAPGQSFTVQDGLVSFDVAGTSVSVDGMPAPVLYTQPNQINFIIPWSLRTDGTRVPICITVKGDKTCLYAVTDSIAPGFFSVNSQIAAINQDGTINSLDHPARYGSYVSLYMTGMGHIQAPEIDGGVSGLPTQSVMATASARFIFCYVPKPGAIGVALAPSIAPDYCTSASPPRDATILFAGAVPTLVSGVDVVIMRVPPGNMLSAQPTSIALQVLASPDRSPVTVTGTIYAGP